MTMLGEGATKHSAATAVGNVAPAAGSIKVMIVDDSAVVRGLVARWVDEEPGLVTVARHPNGKLAVEDVAASEPDMILLDIDMPVMDGLTALPLLLRARPAAKVLVVSTLSQRNAEISFTALSLGALDYVPKPSSNRDITLLPEFRSEVIRKIKALGGLRKAERRRNLEHESAIVHARGANTRPFSLVPPRIIAIGSSTGGPQALAAVLDPLAPLLARVPVVVAQHMPPMFTTVLAERLGRSTGRKVREGVDGEPIKPGVIYIAPGDRHMTVSANGQSLRLSDEPPVHYCRPAVDPLFGSVAASYGPAALGVVLTGMGSDGAAGARAIADAGGSVIAQDESSSVVWGMPGAAVAAGACAATLPPAAIAHAAAKLMRGERP
jgi:two-component system, chemotaxis family, protein-glutamate methylesterase/glutaminase